MIIENRKDRTYFKPVKYEILPFLKYYAVVIIGDSIQLQSTHCRIILTFEEAREIKALIEGALKNAA